MLIPVLLVTYNQISLQGTIFLPLACCLGGGGEIKPVFLFPPIFRLPPHREAWVQQQLLWEEEKQLGPTFPCSATQPSFLLCVLCTFLPASYHQA